VLRVLTISVPYSIKAVTQFSTPLRSIKNKKLRDIFLNYVARSTTMVLNKPQI